MSDAKSTTVEILGREYRIRGVADEEYIREVAKYVDEKMREVQQATALPSQDRLGILVALNIADEFFQLRRSSTDGITSIEKRAERLIEMLDDTFLEAE